jgi:hypothetical protein
MVETAIYSQWQHNEGTPLYYARWDGGEIDMVSLDSRQKVLWCVEIKWSNRFAENPSELKNLKLFCKKHKLGGGPGITTIDIEKEIDYDGMILRFIPASLYCYTVGKNLVDGKLTDTNPQAVALAL